MKVDRLMKLLKTPIVEELYNSRCEDFEREKMKRKEAGETHLDKITNSFNKIIKYSKNDEKISNELEKIYKELLLYSVFWDKEYYKLGITDGIKLFQELENVRPINIQNYTNSFLDNYNTDYEEFIEDFKVKVLYKNKRYDEIRKRISSIKKQYEKVLHFFEDKELADFNDEEKKAILEIMLLEDEQNSIEVKEAFVLGIRERKML